MALSTTLSLCPYVHVHVLRVLLPVLLHHRLLLLLVVAVVLGNIISFTSHRH